MHTILMKFNTYGKTTYVGFSILSKAERLLLSMNHPTPVGRANLSNKSGFYLQLNFNGK